MRKTTSDLWFNRRKHRLAQMIAIVFAFAVGVALWYSLANEEGAQDKGITAEKDLDPDFLQWLILENKASEDELTPDEAKKRSRLGARVFDRLISAFMARYILEGTVVDQDGNRLDGVQLSINKAKTRGPDRWAEEKTEQTINGAFALDLNGYTAIYLYFNKDGYYQEMLSYGYDGGETTAEDIVLRDRPARRNLVEKRDIRVVMEKMGDVTKLMAQNFRLSYRFKDDVHLGHVVDFDRDKWQRRFEGRGHLNALLAKNLLDDKHMPQNRMYVVSEIDNTGRILSVDKARPEWHRPHFLPERMRLSISDPEGGFLLYEQQKGERAFWTMEQAPESGYQQELIIDADLLNKRSPMATTGADYGVYFYFKIDNRFGKGRIDRTEITEEGKELLVHMILQLQMDGSRNLDTGRQY